MSNQLWAFGTECNIQFTLTLTDTTNKKIKLFADTPSELITKLQNTPYVTHGHVHLACIDDNQIKTLPNWATIPNEQPFDDTQKVPLSKQQLKTILNQLVNTYDKHVNCAEFATKLMLYIAFYAKSIPYETINIPNSYHPNIKNTLSTLNLNCSPNSIPLFTKQLTQDDKHQIKEQLDTGKALTLPLEPGFSVQYINQLATVKFKEKHQIVLIKTENDYLLIDNHGVAKFTEKSLDNFLSDIFNINPTILMIGVYATMLNLNEIPDYMYNAINQNAPNTTIYNVHDNRFVSASKQNELDTTDFPISESFNLYQTRVPDSLKVFIFDNLSDIIQPDMYLIGKPITETKANVQLGKLDLQQQQEQTLASPKDLFSDFLTNENTNETKFEFDF